MDSNARGSEVGMSGNTLSLVKHSTVKGSNEWMTEMGLHCSEKVSPRGGAELGSK